MSRNWFGRRERAGGGLDMQSPGGHPSDQPSPASAASPPSPPSSQAPLLTVDALGRKCPIPIIMVAEQIRDVPVGAVIALLADDPAAYTDVPAWCGMKSHEFVYRDELESGWAFGIRRRY